MRVLLPPPGRSRIRVTRRVAVSTAVVAVLIVAAALFAVRATAPERLQRWSGACQSRGGVVVAVRPETGNPLIVQSNDTTYECRASDGHVMSYWR